MNPTLERLIRQRQEQEAFIAQLLEQVESEERDLVDAEVKNLEAAQARIAEIDEQIKPLEAWEKQVEAHRVEMPAPPTQAERDRELVGAGLPAGGSTFTYPAGFQGGGRRSPMSVEPRPVLYKSAGAFVVDYIRARGYPGAKIESDPDAAQRVAQALMARAAAPHVTTEETPGLLPEPIIGEILTDLDSSRPFVVSIGAKDMSSIPGKIFNRPKVTQHSLVGQQPAEKGTLANRQFKVEGVPFEKDTFGGYLNVSRQDIDWTSPAAWDALISDLQLEYGADTDDFAAGLFGIGVTQSVPLEVAEGEENAELRALIRALYAAARMAATANGTKRATALRLPNHVWVSIDQWELLGAAIDMVRALVQGSASPGASSPTSFAGSILDVPRSMVPGLPEGSLIVGRTQLFEFYEERIGILSAIEPKVLGVEVAYGGYAAAGFLDDTAFVKVESGEPEEEPEG